MRIQKSSEMSGESSTPGPGAGRSEACSGPHPSDPKEHPFLEAFPVKLLVTGFQGPHHTRIARPEAGDPLQLLPPQLVSGSCVCVSV